MLSIKSYHQDRVKDLCSSRGPLPFSVHKLTFGGRNQHMPNVLHYPFEKRNCSESSQGRRETVPACCPAFLWLEPNSPPYIIWRGASELFHHGYFLFLSFFLLLGTYDDFIFLFIDLIVILMLITRPPVHLGLSDHITLVPKHTQRICSGKTVIKTVPVWSEEATSMLQDCSDNTDWELCVGETDLKEYAAFVLAYIYLHWKCHKKKEIKLFPNQKPTAI